VANNPYSQLIKLDYGKVSYLKGGNRGYKKMKAFPIGAGYDLLNEI
jgi:hypothetical protein